MSTTLITKGKKSFSQPVFSPNGKRIAFVSTDGTGFDQIYTIPARGGTTTKVTRGAMPR